MTAITIKMLIEVQELILSTFKNWLAYQVKTSTLKYIYTHEFYKKNNDLGKL